MARGTDIWLPGWPGLTPGCGMMTLWTPAPPTDTGGAATREWSAAALSDDETQDSNKDFL